MNSLQNLSGSRYGAYELKSLYRRNMLLGTMISALLAIATTAGAFLFTQSEKAVTVGESQTRVDSIIVMLTDKYNIIPAWPKRGGHNRPLINTEGHKIIPVDDDEPFDDNVTLFSLTDPFITGPIGDDTGAVESYISNPYYGSGGGGEYPHHNTFISCELLPEMIYGHQPEYPRLAPVAGMVAVVWVKALVDIDGSVRDAIIFKSSNSKAGFNSAALTAAYQCKYKPGIQNGRLVPVWVTYRVEFVLEGSR